MRGWFVSSVSMLLVLSACSSSDSGSNASAGGAAGAGASGGSAGAAGTAGSGGSSGSAGATGELPCDIEQLLTERCQQCHSNPTKFGAPMSMVSRADLLAPSPTDPSLSVGEKSVARMRDLVKPMPQPPNPKATDAEISAFETWVNAGMPASTENCNGTGGSAGSAGAAGSGGSAGSAGSGGGATCTPDVTIKSPTPWTIKQSVGDQYVCFGGKIAASPVKRQITEVYVGIDNSAHAHHLCVYDMGTMQVSPEATECSAGSAIANGKLLYCWAPGAGPETLPPEAGFALEANQETNILVEMHYSNIQGLPDSTDNSSATFCTTENLRPNDADVMAFGSMDFNLPPHVATTVECSVDIGAFPLPGGQLHAVRGWPHMHLLGEAQSTIVTNGGTQVGDLGSTSSYSFYNQIGYPLDVTAGAGDTVTTKCSYNNTTNNAVSFGENTESEMCYNFVTYYPKITSSQWVWAAPAYFGSCTSYPTP